MARYYTTATKSGMGCVRDSVNPRAGVVAGPYATMAEAQAEAARASAIRESGDQSVIVWAPAAAAINPAPVGATAQEYLAGNERKAGAGPDVA